MSLAAHQTQCLYYHCLRCSSRVTVWYDSPAFVGLPVISPVFASNVSPAGTFGGTLPASENVGDGTPVCRDTITKILTDAQPGAAVPLRAVVLANRGAVSPSR